MSQLVVEPPSERVSHPHRTIENVPGRLGTVPVNRVMSAAGMPWQRRLSRAALMVPAIRHWERVHLKLNDDDLKGVSMALRGKARGKVSLDKLLPEAFGLCSVAIQRVLNIRPFDVQLAAGVVMHFGGLVELATGEGKTVSASSPAFLNALLGKGCHVTTVNDYLAKRDAEWIGPVYEKLGLTVGVLQQKMDDAVRVAAYKADITYGTAAEFGFDFLRDRLKLRGGQAATAPFWAPFMPGASGQAKTDPRVQRELHYAIVDEADSIFIDEAKTPLIIANPTRPAEPEEQVVFVWADNVAREMRRDQHFTLNLKKDKIEITDEGRQLVRYSNPPTGKNAKAMDKLLESVEKGLHAYYRFARDQHYMVNPKDGKIVIIDEGTGRPMPDRHWRDGLHQAVEAKEKVQINMPSDHAAQITFQNFYRLYTKLAGMSGTLLPNFWELRKVYRRWTSKVPTNRPTMRQVIPDQVYPTEDAKFDAVVRKTQEMLKTHRPVLIGTRTVEASKKLSAKLTAVGVRHRVLNAEQNEGEAEVVAAAGQPDTVTVATNMAGRGTDIKLGEGVAEAGGLHVIGTERHEAERIDRQLQGRAGRQGDPGSAQFMLSLEDQLLEGLGSAKQRELNELGKAGGNRDWNQYAPLFRLAQQRIERKHYRQRLDLMNYDKHRQEMLQDIGADPYVD
ncbi:preprotein translocase subunit SecA [Urbifossiella limnaea]|uniref:Protein translocase subunit SecA n=1 Tax=Urbifossiella limnaea TaxID=2528023 RepID=A0A517XQ73_9BACT|nr:preprotein translocase subunit SecA [Urbifossiella limnaea]QDU19659.1 preprotein translocase subunit SecA [Urbifossiella limnaea]